MKRDDAKKNRSRNVRLAVFRCVKLLFRVVYSLFVKMFRLYQIFVVFCCVQLIRTDYVQKFEPDYEKALQLSLLYYEAQRSGRLPENNRVRWRSDSAVHDRGNNGEDLSGGYYDVGSDFVKFTYTMAYSTTVLAWGVFNYDSGYKKSGQYNHVLDAIKWAADYFIKCHTAPEELYGQVGDITLEPKFWGRPEQLNTPRPAFKIDKEHPGTDLACGVSAALTAASLVFERENETYSKELLRHAIELYNFGNKYRGLYRNAIPGTRDYYKSNSYGQELVWASMWLYQATFEDIYLNNAEKFYIEFNQSVRHDGFSYNNISAGIQVLLADATRNLKYLEAVMHFCDHAADEQLKTPGGLVFITKRGTLPNAANVAFICLEAARLNIFPAKNIQFAKKQINYCLGSQGHSFVVGYGKNFPKRPYHSASSCPNLPRTCDIQQLNSTSLNPQILYGALVSGPNQSDYYEDIRDFVFNGVTLDHNAGFQSALAAIIHFANAEDYY